MTAVISHLCSNAAAPWTSVISSLSPVIVDTMPVIHHKQKKEIYQGHVRNSALSCRDIWLLTSLYIKGDVSDFNKYHTWNVSTWQSTETGERITFCTLFVWCLKSHPINFLNASCCEQFIHAFVYYEPVIFNQNVITLPSDEIRLFFSKVLCLICPVISSA